MRARMAPEDPHRDKVEIIVAETERLERILRTQLTFLQLPDIQWAAVDLNQLAAETLSLVRPRAEERGITLEIGLERRLPPVQADGDQLKQVLLNLLQNAVESAGTGGAVKLSTGTRGAELVTRIANSGPPIPPEALPRLFVPYYTTKAKGSGLGLPISQDIVKRHGGRIEVTRETDWTVFAVVLPRTNGNGQGGGHEDAAGRG
jgi:signal transduction histidine kinase